MITFNAVLTCDKCKKEDRIQFTMQDCNERIGNVGPRNVWEHINKSAWLITPHDKHVCPSCVHSYNGLVRSINKLKQEYWK